MKRGGAFGESYDQKTHPEAAKNQTFCCYENLGLTGWDCEMGGQPPMRGCFLLVHKNANRMIKIKFKRKTLHPQERYGNCMKKEPD